VIARRANSLGVVGIIVLSAFVLASCSSSSKAATTTSTSAAAPAVSTSTIESTTVAPQTTTAPTTAATTPVEPAAPAVSASFVSPDQGFALEQNGNIDSTNDRGTTWHRVGSTRRPSLGFKIRFIGPSDGFAFGPGTSSLMITHDAGASWTNLTTPFRTVEDLAVLRGMIYVVGIAPRATGSLGIWSTPTGHLVWKRDPLSLQIGAGPVPTAQVVLSGNGGWILVVNRTVISGARLSGTTWSAWNPPCLGKNGPAFLAASTAADVIATCNEGVWGPPKPATTVYVSHNAGTTFTRTVVPGFGPLAAATPTTAIIVGNGNLWRTVDSGASWNIAARYDDRDSTSARDLGFTTPTQGFVVLGSGTVLMTHDAGASWQGVKLP
jgi:photosystem II stability/assembly factor-like uncharacterized protein